MRSRWLLLILAIASPGCAHNPRESLSSLWHSVPGTSWGKPLAESSPKKKAPDAKVSANVAAADKARNDKPSAEKSDSKRGRKSDLVAEKQQRDREATGTGLAERAPYGVTGRETRTGIRKEIVANADRSSSAIAQASGTQPPQRDAVGRLKAALSEDVRRDDKERSPGRDQEEMRLRVESLLADARSNLERGRTEEAQRITRLARDLSEHARLEFSPNEERPIDLLRRIDQQLEQSRAVAKEADELQPASAKSRVELTSQFIDRKKMNLPGGRVAEGAPRQKPRETGLTDGWQTIPLEGEEPAVEEAASQMQANRGMTLPATEDHPEVAPPRDPFILLEPEGIPDGEALATSLPIRKMNDGIQVVSASPFSLSPPGTNSGDDSAPEPPRLSLPPETGDAAQANAPRPPKSINYGSFEEMEAGELTASTTASNSVWSPFLVGGAGLLLLIGGVLWRKSTRRAPIGPQQE